MDLQAQARAHRIGQTRPVVVYQLITKGTVEEKILLKSKQKLAMENIVMNPSRKPSVDDLQSVLLHGARTILNRKKIQANSILYDEVAIDNLLKLDPVPGETCAPDENGYLGSIESFKTGVGETEESVVSPKEEWKELLRPVKDKRDAIGNFGRGKRVKKAVNYVYDEASDNDASLERSNSTAIDDDDIVGDEDDDDDDGDDDAGDGFVEEAFQDDN